MAIVVYMMQNYVDIMSQMYMFFRPAFRVFRDPQHVTCSRENINHFDLFEKMLKQSIAISKAYKTINVNL